MPAVSKPKIALLSILMALGAVGAPPPSATPSEACPKALHACISLSQAQDDQITQLKQDKTQLAQALAKANQAPLLPIWAWVTLGVLAGTVLGSKIVK